VANEVVAALNALGNMQVLMVEGLVEPSVIYSGGNVVLQIPKIDSTSGGSITVEEEDGTPSVDPVTEIKFPNGSVTDNGGGSVSVAFTSGGGVAMYRLKSVQGDYLTCRTWDGTTEGGTDVFIAKNYKLRNSITSQVIDGVTVNYTYTTTVERDATIGANTETQIIVPRYLSDDLIFAIYSETTGVEKDDDELTLLDINADARAWAVKYVAP